MMSPIVSFYRGLPLNLISTLYQAWKLELMEVHTPSPLRNIYAQCTIVLDSDVLRDLVPFVQFKTCQKHPWRSVTFSKVAGSKPLSLPKVIFLKGVFHVFKLYKWYQIAQVIISEFAINT